MLELQNQYISYLNKLLFSSLKLEQQFFVPWDKVLRIRQEWLKKVTDSPYALHSTKVNGHFVDFGTSHVDRVTKRIKTNKRITHGLVILGSVVGAVLSAAGSKKSPPMRTTSPRNHTDEPPLTKSSINSTTQQIYDARAPLMFNGEPALCESESDVETHQLEGDTDFTAKLRMKARNDERRSEAKNYNLQEDVGAALNALVKII